MGKEQQLLKTEVLYRSNGTVVDLPCYLIAPQMRVDTKKNLLGLRSLWAVVVTRLLGECRVLGINHIARLLLFGSLAIPMSSPGAVALNTGGCESRTRLRPLSRTACPT